VLSVVSVPPSWTVPLHVPLRAVSMIRAPATAAVPAAFLTVKFTDGIRTVTSVVSVALALVGTAGLSPETAAVAGSAPLQSPA